MLDYVYNIVFFLLTYLIPMVVMAACYSQMGYFLSKYERERQTRMIISSSVSTRIRKNKKKVEAWVDILRRNPYLFPSYRGSEKIKNAPQKKFLFPKSHYIL